MTDVTPSPDVVEQFVTACHSDLARVKSLLAEHPSLLHARSKLDESGLGAAAHMNQRAIAEFLLEQGAPLDICTAAMLGRVDAVREMAAAAPDLSQAAGSHGIPAITFAAISGSLEIAELLFSKGARVDAPPNVMTPIHIAVLTNRPEMIEWLIAHHANLEATFGGDTPLRMAEKQKRDQALEVLRRHTAPEPAA